MVAFSRLILLPTVVALAGVAIAPIQAQGSDEPRVAKADKSLRGLRIPVRQFKVIEDQSGSVNYYTVYEDPEGDFIRSLYRPPLETVVLGVKVPDRLQQKAKLIRWRWRALALPKNANECKGYGDSAAVVYVTFKRGLKWYSLKYVWATGGPNGTKKGDVCDKKRNPFVGQDTIVVEAGGPTADWRYVEIDPRADFRNHFEDGNQNADVPDLVGIGIMSDGDQTQTLSSADYGDFMIVE